MDDRNTDKTVFYFYDFSMGYLILELKIKFKNLDTA